MKLIVTDMGEINGCFRACKFYLLLFFAVCLFSEQVHATHAAGADLTYKWLGGMDYQIEATFYRDCSGSSEPGNITIAYKSISCGYSRTILANKVLLNNGEEISLPCATSPSTCNGGITTGIRKWVYRAIVTLPTACSDWVFSYRICCRNCTVTTIQSPCAVNSEIYIEATLNNLVVPANNSPVFNNTPVVFVCLGQNFNYNQGIYDVDGDSLVYELITPKTSDSTEVTWLAPSSTQSPLASSTPFTINPISGDINFTPSVLQIGILAIRVNEFRNGQLIGSTIRDMQVYTQNCTNILPVATGINGTGNYTATICAGEPLCFSIASQDVDSSQNLTFIINNPIQGSSITQTAGNLPSLLFCWTPTTDDISRQPHIFTLTIHDDACPLNGVQTFSYGIYVNGPSTTITAVNPSCGFSNGSLTALVTNEPGCSYSWNTIPPQFTPAISGLDSGNYSVTVTDTLGCVATFDATLNASGNAIQVACLSTGVVSCQSGNIGTVQATPTGGLPPYSYLWNTGALTSSITGLGAGTYYVTVTDANGCSASGSAVITGAAGNLTSGISVINEISCYGGSNGSIGISASGGVAPYTYSWSNGIVTPVNSGLTAGIYTVLVMDVNGCSSTASVAVSQPVAPLSVNFVSSTVSCFGGNNGSINVFVNGGTLPYTYNWSQGASTPVISGLNSGAYSVTVTDFNGCTGTYSTSVIEPALALTVGIASTQEVTCFGGDDGALELVVSGGVSPYSYNWSHGATTSQIQNLEAGVYVVTVTDANGCTMTYADSVAQPSAPVSANAIIISNVSCYGGSNGSLQFMVNGGIAPYNFVWNTGFTGPYLNNIPAGIYQVIIADANGCTTTLVDSVTQPAEPLSVNLSTQQILCYNGDNGSVNATATGGVGNYSYVWSTGSTNPVLSGLGSGTYTVTVTDGNACTANAVSVLTQPNDPLIPVLSVSQPVNCNGIASGALSLLVTGGTTPYSFLWSNGVTTQNTANLVAGTYTVTITDANGCNAIISETVAGPISTLTSSISLEQTITCYGGADGSISVTTQGGEAPYTYTWNTGAQSSGISGLTSGIYSVIVTDNNGCSTTESVILLQPSTGISLSENITGVNCITGQSGSISIDLSGGAPGYSFYWSNGSPSQNLSNLGQGNYTVTVTDAHGCTASEAYEVPVNTEFILTASGDTTICTGETVTLAANALAIGTFQWFYNGMLLNGVSGMQFTTPAAGVYSVSLTNSCGTFNSNEIHVIVKTIGNVSINSNRIICPPQTAQLLATGGVTYKWMPDSYMALSSVPDPIVSPLNTTRYAVLITNEWGCKILLSTEVIVDCDTLEVPTGFSPNADGVNDGYVIDGIENYPGNKLWVYNRWGQLIYKTTDYNNNWNGVGNISGLFKGQKVPSGTYYYILDLNDNQKPRAGSLIIRH